MRVTKVKSSKVATPAKRPATMPLGKQGAVTPAIKMHAALLNKARRSVPLAVSERPAVKRANPSIGPDFSLEEQIGFRLRKANQRATGIFADVMAKYAVTPTQFATMAKIDEIGPMSQPQLERSTALDHAEMLSVIGRLQRQNLLRVRPAPQDLRLIQIELTHEAQALIAEMKAAANKVAVKTLAPLSAQEAKTLQALLERIG
jgi:MarR family transcriptional regulator, lower aerobic nicotinate degradation pathway regulator